VRIGLDVADGGFDGSDVSAVVAVDRALGAALGAAGDVDADGSKNLVCDVLGRGGKRSRGSQAGGASQQPGDRGGGEGLPTEPPATAAATSDDLGDRQPMGVVDLRVERSLTEAPE
jgi:hypothetical protein